MQRPRDAWHLSPDEGATLLERLARHTVRAEDRCVLVQVVRWLLWLVCVVQEATRSLTWLRTVLCGKGAHGSQARAPAAATSRALGGEREDGGARRSMTCIPMYGPRCLRGKEAPAFWALTRVTVDALRSRVPSCEAAL